MSPVPNRWSLGVLVLGALVGLSGCTSTWVNSVSTSPDGKHVNVVGAKLVNQGFGYYPSEPIQWQCVRGEDGKLSCKRLAKVLPKM
jgi:hypothetical protein